MHCMKKYMSKIKITILLMQYEFYEILIFLIFHKYQHKLLLLTINILTKYIYFPAFISIVTYKNFNCLQAIEMFKRLFFK